MRMFLYLIFDQMKTQILSKLIMTMSEDRIIFVFGVILKFDETKVRYIKSNQSFSLIYRIFYLRRYYRRADFRAPCLAIYIYIIHIFAKIHRVTTALKAYVGNT